MGHGSLLRLGPAMAHFLEKEKPKLSALADAAIKPKDLDAKFDGRGGLGDDKSSEPLLMQSATTVKEDHGRMDKCGGNDIVLSSKFVNFGNNKHGVGGFGVGVGRGESKMHPKQEFVMAATNKVTMDDHVGKEDAVGGKNVSSKSLKVSHCMQSLHDDPFYPCHLFISAMPCVS